jgi:hypothetical protein
MFWLLRSVYGITLVYSLSDDVKKQIVKFILCLGMLALVPMARGQFSYTINNGAVTITGYNPAAGLNMVIPASTNGFPVLAIGYNAWFRDVGNG